MPDISVIIPCYNAATWVGRAIESVLAQKGVSVDVIVVDDGSTDDSLDAIRAFADQVRIETGLNAGACASRNKGLALARADYVMFLDADDYLQGRFLAGHHKALSETGADICLGQVFDSSLVTDARKRKMPEVASSERLLTDWLSGNFVPPCGIVWRKTLLGALGGWDENLSKNQDGDLMFRAINAGATFARTTSGQGIYWQHDGPDRISGTISLSKARDHVAVLDRLFQNLESNGNLTPDLEKAISQALHRFERNCFRSGALDAATFVASARRERNWPKYEGSSTHILFSYALGLKRKERLSFLIGNLLAGAVGRARKENMARFFKNRHRPR